MAAPRGEGGGAVRGAVGIGSGDRECIAQRARAAARSSPPRAAAPRSSRAAAAARPRRRRLRRRPSSPAGRGTRPSARARELSTPAPRRSGRPTSSVADAADAHPHPLVAAAGSMRIATRAVARSLSGAGARFAAELRKERAAEQLERQGRRDRVAGNADHRRRADEPEHDRVAGLDRHSLDDDLPDPLRSPRPCGRRPPRRAREEEDEIGLRGAACSSATASSAGSSADDRRRRGRGRRPRSTIAASMSEFVSTIWPGPSSAPSGTSSSPEGRIATTGRLRTTIVALPAEASDREVGRAEASSGLRAARSPAADVLADLADVRVRRSRCATVAAPAVTTASSRRTTASVPGGQRIAGVDRLERRLRRASTGAPAVVAAATAMPVHRGGVEGGRGAAGDDRLGGDPAERRSRASIGLGRQKLQSRRHRGARRARRRAPSATSRRCAVARSLAAPLGQSGSRAAARLRLRHDDAEAGGATALQYRRRACASAARRGGSATIALAVEEPLELRIGGAPVAVTMRTPGPRRGARARVRALGGPAAARAPACRTTWPRTRSSSRRRASTPSRLARSFYTTSSCGVCGKGALEAIAVESPLVESTLTMPAAVVGSLPDRLREAQAAFASTGGLHATGLFTADGELVCAREDVGRHNAMDKVIGRAFLDGLLPLARHVLCVSGRLSFELVQKAAVAGCPVRRRRRRAVVARRRARRRPRGDAVRLRARRPPERLLAPGAHRVGRDRSRRYSKLSRSTPGGDVEQGAREDRLGVAVEPDETDRAGRRGLRRAGSPSCPARHVEDVQPRVCHHARPRPVADVGEERRDRVRLDRRLRLDAGLVEDAVHDAPVLHVAGQEAER